MAGDAEAFAGLVRRHASPVYALLHRLVRDREEAEDLSQETFLKAYRFLGRFEPGRPFRNWLYAIATRTGLNALRSRRRRGMAVSLDDEEAMEGREPVDPWADARSLAGRAELAERVGAAVARLSPRPALLVDLHYRQGLSIREAAEVVGMSADAAKVALCRARRTLREWLVEDEELRP